MNNSALHLAHDEHAGDASGETEGPSLQNTLAYQRDLLERSILFWDALRQRANNMLERQRAGLPPLLDFKYETLFVARRLNQSADARRSRDALSESAFRLFYDREAQM